MLNYPAELKKVLSDYEKIRLKEPEHRTRSHRMGETMRVVQLNLDNRSYLSLCEQLGVEPILYTIRYTSLAMNPTYIGLYATRAAAHRVASAAKTSDKVLFQTLSHATRTVEMDAHVKTCAHKMYLPLNRPTAKPREHVSFHKESGRLKIKTLDHHGFFGGSIRGMQSAYNLRDALLCSGDLNVYIDTYR